MTAQNSKNEIVVLLHGILRSRTDMLGLEGYLLKQGYETINILYPSRKKNLEDLTDFVADKIENHPAYSPEKTLNFVTHSMGGLIARYYIATHKPENLGKVVMLGPPNTGSEFADFLSENKLLAPLFKNIFGPASAQLTTSYDHIEDDITYPLGVIAGNASINPLAPWVFPNHKGAHDGIVPVERTKIKGMTDHIVMKSTHTFMMFNPKVMRQVHKFLKHGKFAHDNDKSNEELVVLLHGIANPAFVMSPIDIHLFMHGYETLNIEYPSQSESIDRLTKYIHRALRKNKASDYKKLHFVCFSLGGLVLRSYLMRTTPSNLGRVVMLGTPNQGTQAADSLKDAWFYRLFFGKAGQELTTDRFSMDTEINYDLGIIAGTQNTLSPATMLMHQSLPEPNDGAVSVESTKIKGMKDHTTLPVNHTALITDNRAKEQITHFLNHGKFKKMKK